MRMNYKAKTVAAFTLAWTILVSVGVNSYQLSLRADREVFLLKHTHVVLEKLERVRLALVEAEASRRGYALAHDAEFLRAHQRSREQLSAAVQSVRLLTAGDAVQQHRLDVLEPLILLRMSFHQRLLSQPGGGNQSEQADLIIKGLQTMEQIELQISALEEEEKIAVEKHFQAEHRAFRESPWIIFLGTAVALALLAGSSFLYWREVNRRLKSERKFHELLEAAPDAIVVANSLGKIIFVNRQTEILFGHSSGELRGKPVEMLIPQRFRRVHPKHREGFHAAPRARPMGKGMALFGLRRDGSEFPIEISLSPLETDEGAVVVSTILDITERMEFQEDLHRRTEDLEATNRELEAFTYSVSHDLRAPLRHIDGFSRILLDEHGGHLSAQGQRHLQRIREATLQMGNLVDDLLNLSRLGRQPLTLQETDLNILVTSVKTDLASEPARRHIEWNIAMLPIVECDPGLIKQVFSNLLANAIKFTRPREKARIEIGLATEDGHSAIFVRDNGVGFNMKYADKLFGVFQRLHRQEDFEGTGVGLATVERILRKHGGRIWARAETGRGATFYFTLPSLTHLKEKDAETMGARA